MNYRFPIILTISMIGFAIGIAFMIMTSDYFKLREQAIQNKWSQVQQNEVIAKYALETIEKAYNMFGDQIGSKMKESTDYLLDLYDANPSFEEWDFASLKRMLSSDIYIINDQNVITHSSHESDIGLDFKVCCKGLSNILDARRASGGFYQDGIDLEQTTGKLKKYSYTATRDKRFIIELGYSLEESEIFNEFNFRNTIEQFVKTSPSIYEVRVLNSAGVSLGGSVQDDPALTPEQRKAFVETLRTGRTVELEGEWRKEPAIYRYVQYVSNYDQGVTKTKVLEIVYTLNDLRAALNDHKTTFLFQLAGIVVIALAISFVISRWVAKPLYYAFHDSLTGLKNRAAFDELIPKFIAESRDSVALFLIDLDNFKLVNDTLGHDKGDHLLKCVAQCIRKASHKGDYSFRLGGDEFVLVMRALSKHDAERVAEVIIETIARKTAQEIPLEDETVTVSIGIALAAGHGADPDTLRKQADQALYASKEKGKNQYQLYGS